MNYDEKKKSKCEDQIQQVQTKLTEAKDLYDKLSAELKHLDFNLLYTPPRDFDQNSVKGLVAKLIKVKDKTHATAVQVTAGGKLFNVVVDTEVTGKQLLQKGKLKQRITIIPLNKIASKKISPEVISNAEKLVGKGRASLALSLVGYPEEVKAAIEYVFGNTFICPEQKDAEAVTYAPNIKTRAVTYEGDVFDPRGTLTGGSSPTGNGPSLLVQIEKLNEAEAKYETLQKQMSALRNELEAATKKENAARKKTTERELLEHEIKLLKDRKQESAFSKLQTQCEELSKELEKTEQIALEASAESKKATEKAKQLERSMKDFEKERQNQQKEYEKQVTQEKKKLTAATKELKEAQQELDKINLELEQLNEELKTQERTVEKAERSLADLIKEISKLETKVAECKRDYDEAKKHLETEKKNKDRRRRCKNFKIKERTDQSCKIVGR